MSWVRLDDGFADHPKVMAAGPIGAAIQVRALCYASRYLTDGFLPAAAIPGLLAGLEHIGIEYASACEGMVGFVDEAHEIDWPAVLVAHRLWEVVAGGYRIHDFLDYNPSKREIERLRREKQRAGKKGAKSRWSMVDSPVASAMAPALALPMAPANPKGMPPTPPPPPNPERVGTTHPDSPPTSPHAEPTGSAPGLSRDQPGSDGADGGRPTPAPVHRQCPRCHQTWLGGPRCPQEAQHALRA